MPIPTESYKDKGIRNELNRMSQAAHGLAKEMLNGDADLLKQINLLLKQHTKPFAHTNNCDLSGYFAEIDIETAQVTENGELTSNKLGIIKGEPAILQYIIARASLEAKDALSKKEIENFPVPIDPATCNSALELMDNWALRKPTLLQKLKIVQNGVDDLVLESFTILDEKERKYMKERAMQFPLNKVIVPDAPGVPTKRIAVKYWKTGERYK